MATQTQNAKTLIDALLDAAGRAPSTPGQALRVVENLTKTWDSGLTNEQKAQNFNIMIAKHIRRLVKANAEARKDAEDDASVAAAGDAAAGDV